MSPANRDNFTPSFLIRTPFIPFSYLLRVTRASNTVLKRSESGHPCLFPDTRDNAFSFSPLSVMLAVCSYMFFITSTLRYAPSIPTFLKAFIVDGC